MRLFVRYRGQALTLELADSVTVNAMPCRTPSIRVAVNGEIYEVVESERRSFALK